MEYTLSSLIGRFTAQYGNPYEQTRTMESHKLFLLAHLTKTALFSVNPNPLLARKYFQRSSTWTETWRRRRQSFSKKRRTCEIWSIRYERKLLPGFFQSFCFFTPFWGRFPIWLFSNGLKPTRNLSTWKKTLGCSRPRDCGCSNGALGRDTCMKLFVCSEAANAELQQRLEEAGGGYYNIVEIPLRFVLEHVACKISGVVWKNQCQENSQVQKTQFCSLFLDDACGVRCILVADVGSSQASKANKELEVIEALM